jgi:hypothetical protein
MANKQRGFVEVQLDKKRTLRYTLNALAELEDRLGVSVSELTNVPMGMKQIRTFLWAGLLHEAPDITEQEVGNLVDFENMEYVSQKITEAFTKSAKNSKGPTGQN